MKMAHRLFLLLILSMMITINFGIKLNVVHEWKYANYEWNSQEQAEHFNTYDPHMCDFRDADKAEDGRVFVTVPMLLGPGSPATLATVTNKTGPGGPLLRPYPDWSWHNSSFNCDGIINVYRVNIRCNHIFVLDNGKIGNDEICNPKLLIFDLKDDTLIKTIYIPRDIATNQIGLGLLTMVLVYIPGECTQFLDKMIVFVADTWGSGLVVYDSSKLRMCRVESDYMKPTDVFFNIGNENFTYDLGGIYSLTFHDDDLYYAPVSGKAIYKIKIKTLLECPNKEEANKQTELVINLSSQTIDITSAKHSLFYSDSRAASILRTDISKESDENTVILVQDDEKFQSVSSMKISHDGNQLRCFSDRFQRYIKNTLNLNKINFRYFELTDLY